MTAPNAESRTPGSTPGGVGAAPKGSVVQSEGVGFPQAHSSPPTAEYRIALRPDDPVDPYRMDDIVVMDVKMFRAEQMDTGSWWSGCEDRLFALLAAHRTRIVRVAGWLARADMRIVELLHRGMPPERTPAPMADHHHIVEYDTRFDMYRTGPARRYAFCTKDGCGWWWNGIGRLEPVKAEHEALNQADGCLAREGRP